MIESFIEYIYLYLYIYIYFFEKIPNHNYLKCATGDQNKILNNKYFE